MIEHIDEVAEAAEKGYSAFLLQLIGSFSQAMDEPAPTAPVARAGFRRAADHSQVQTLTALATRLDQAAETLVKDAVAHANPSLSTPEIDNVFTVIEEARGALIAQIMQASEKDIDTVARSLRELSLLVDNLMHVQGSTYVSALFGAKMRLNTDFRFSQLDRLGRKYPSHHYARTSVRAFLVGTYIDTYIYALASRGVDMVIVKHPEQDHPHAGLAFSISGAIPNMPAYQDIKSEVWHPNSRALVSHS